MDGIWFIAFIYLAAAVLAVPLVMREVYDTAVGLGTEALRLLGMRAIEAQRLARAFRRHEAQGLADLHDLWIENPDITRNLALQVRIRAHVGALQDALTAAPRAAARPQDENRSHDR